MRALPIAVLLFAAACSGSTPKATPTTPPVVTHPATAKPAPTNSFVITKASVPTTFTNPDHTVFCDIEPAFARCDVHPHTWTAPPKPDDCHENWGFGVVYQLQTKATFFCAADSLRGATRVLPVGHAFQVDLVECDSTTAGIRCLQIGAKDGFLISKSSYRFF